MLSAPLSLDEFSTAQNKTTGHFINASSGFPLFLSSNIYTITNIIAELARRSEMEKSHEAS